MMHWVLWALLTFALCVFTFMVAIVIDVIEKRSDHGRME